MSNLNAVNAMPADELAALDAAMADFDLDENTDIVEPDMDDESLNDLTLGDITELAGSPDDDTIMELDAKLSVQESYQTQPAEPVGTTAAPVTAETKPEKVKRERKASAAPTRVPRDINTVADGFFVLTNETDPADMSAADLTAAKAATLALKPAQVKVAEKFDNLFTALSVGKQPSSYTQIAFGILNAKGTMTSTDLVSAYKASLTSKGDPMKEGTARSQAGQLMNLLNTVKIADRNGQTLVLRSDSLLAERLRNLPAAAE